MKVKITLPNGLTVEGEKEDVRKVLESTGYVEPNTKYYYSKSRGLLPIKDMATAHIMNTVLKMYREWVADLSNIEDPQVLYAKLMMGDPDVEVWYDLMSELHTRKDLYIK